MTLKRKPVRGVGKKPLKLRYSFRLHIRTLKAIADYAHANGYGYRGRTKAMEEMIIKQAKAVSNGAGHGSKTQ